MAKTIFFEKHYGMELTPHTTLHDIDACIEKKIGRKLEILNCDIFPIKKYDIEGNLDKALAEPNTIYRFLNYLGL